MIILESKNITKLYGNHKEDNISIAVNGINIKVHKGDFIAIMGPSGSGKTTLLNMLSGLSRPTSGFIEFGGKNLNLIKDNELSIIRRKSMGFIFQDFNLMDSLTLKENIMLPMILEKKPVHHMEKVCNEIIETVGIEKIINKYPYNVSGGEQQRTAIARALVNNPDIIFADEPTGNLDSKSSTSVMSCFDNVNQKNLGTILMVTHDVFAASYCKKVIFIKDGKIHLEIEKKETRKEFFNKILDCISMLEGDISEIS